MATTLLHHTVVTSIGLLSLRTAMSVFRLPQRRSQTFYNQKKQSRINHQLILLKKLSTSVSYLKSIFSAGISCNLAFMAANRFVTVGAERTKMVLSMITSNAKSGARQHTDNKSLNLWRSYPPVGRNFRRTNFAVVHSSLCSKPLALGHQPMFLNLCIF